MQHEEFPDTYLPHVARAADRAMREVLEEDRALAAFEAQLAPHIGSPAVRRQRGRV